MIESIVLGTIQGIAEWLPISSEGLIFLIKANFFNNGESIKEIASLALFLHGGTFLAALVYFRKDVWRLIKALFDFREAENADKKTLLFLIITTALTGVFGYSLLLVIDGINLEKINYATKIITFLIGLLLLVTAFLQLAIKKKGQKNQELIDNGDGVVLGLVQSLAVLPGLSRSGLTVAALLFRNFQDSSALKLSFLMSLPVILGGNIVLNFNKFSFNNFYFVGFLFAFVFGLITIDLFLKLARKLNLGYFVFIFGLLMVVASFI